MTTVSPAPSAPSPPELRWSLDLGWHMAELYGRLRPRDLRAPSPNELDEARLKREGSVLAIYGAVEDHPIELQVDLPGRGALTDRQKTELLLEEIEVGFRRLEPALAAAGFRPPNSAEWRSLLPFIGSPEAHYELGRSILAGHVTLLSHLSATEPTYGKAYGLGRALADITLRITENDDDESALTRDLHGERVATITRWLSELRSLLPAHAAAAVSGSVRTWRDWASDPKWDNGTLDWTRDRANVIQALRSQGEDWRAYLSGDKSVIDRLEIGDYIRAGEYLAGRIRRLLQRFAAQYWIWLSIVSLVAVGGVLTALLVFGSDTAKIVGAGASVLGAVGITGQAARGAVGKPLREAESVLWQAELDQTAAQAITRIPETARPAAKDVPEPPRLRRRSVNQR